jgi:hypothetical protein
VRDFPRLKNRAAFDLDCSPDQLTLVTLNILASPSGNRPSEVGVRGCGRKAVYVPRDEAWMLYGGPSKSYDDPPAAKPAAPVTVGVTSAPPALDKPMAPDNH